MTRSERRWCLAYAILLIVLTTAPYLLGLASQGTAWRFSGFVFGVEDGNSYIAKMRLGAQGAWLFRTPYSTLPQQGVFAFLPYLLLGKIASGPGLHEQLVALYHLARVGAILLLVPATYSFAAHFLSSTAWRRWVTVLASLGGGLGWLAVWMGATHWQGSLPLDLISPESFGFLSVLGLPHLAAARALLLLGLLSYLRAPRLLVPQLGGALAFLLMGLLQPISLVPAYAVMGFHVCLIWLTRRDTSQLKAWLRRFLLSASLSIPLFAYSFLAFLGDPFLRAWTAQNRILSPPPAHYLLAYGLILVPAVAGIVFAMRERTGDRIVLAGWVILLPVLAYFPHNLQRRLPEGVWVALLILAALTLQDWVGGRHWRRWVIAGLSTVSLLTSLLLWSGAMQVAAHPSAPAFLPSSQITAFRWLEEHAPPGSVVLGSFATGNALPAWAPVRVVIGHGPETIDLSRLRERVHDFYALADEKARSELLREQTVDFVYCGPDEQALAGPAGWMAGGMSLVFDESGVRLYAVER